MCVPACDAWDLPGVAYFCPTIAPLGTRAATGTATSTRPPPALPLPLPLAPLVLGPAPPLPALPPPTPGRLSCLAALPPCPACSAPTPPSSVASSSVCSASSCSMGSPAVPLVAALPVSSACRSARAWDWVRSEARPPPLLPPLPLLARAALRAERAPLGEAIAMAGAEPAGGSTPAAPACGEAVAWPSCSMRLGRGCCSAYAWRCGCGPLSGGHGVAGCLCGKGLWAHLVPVRPTRAGPAHGEERAHTFWVQR